MRIRNKSIIAKLLLLFISVSILTACNEDEQNTNKGLDIENLNLSYDLNVKHVNQIYYGYDFSGMPEDKNLNYPLFNFTDKSGTHSNLPIELIRSNKIKVVCFWRDRGVIDGLKKIFLEWTSTDAKIRDGRYANVYFPGQTTKNEKLTYSNITIPENCIGVNNNFHWDMLAFISPQNKILFACKNVDYRVSSFDAKDFNELQSYININYKNFLPRQ